MIRDSKQTKLRFVILFLLLVIIISACRLGETFIPVPSSTPTSTLTAIATSTITPVPTPIGGGLIAFLRPIDSHFCFIHADGSDQTCLDIQGSDQPAWSPNGNQLVFCSFKEGNSGLSMMNIDGLAITQLPRITELDRFPSWSPDGKQIAFSGTNGIVYVMNTDGTNVTRLTNVVCMYPVWSPDGKHIAIAGTTIRLSGSSCNVRGIYIMNADGSNLVLVTKLPEGEVKDIAWSPDGKHIIFASNSDAPPNADSFYLDIYSVDVDGSNLTQLTHGGKGGFNLTWSPDSKYIAFDNRNSEKRQHLIYIMNSDGSNITILTEGSYPAWQP